MWKLLDIWIKFNIFIAAMNVYTIVRFSNPDWTMNESDKFHCTSVNVLDIIVAPARPIYCGVAELILLE